MMVRDFKVVWQIMDALMGLSVYGREFGLEMHKNIQEHYKEITSLRPKLQLKWLSKLLCGAYILDVFLAYPEVFCAIIPELQIIRDVDHKSKYHLYNIWEHTGMVIMMTPPTPRLRLAALLHDLGKPHCLTIDENGFRHYYGHPAISSDLALRIFARMKFRTSDAEKIIRLVHYHDDRPPKTLHKTQKWVEEVGDDIMDDLFALKRADVSAHSNNAFKRGYEDIARGINFLNIIRSKNK